ARKLQELARHSLFQAVNTRNTVTHHDDGTDALDFHLGLEPLNLFFENGANFLGTNGHPPHPSSCNLPPRRCSRSRSSRVSTPPPITTSPTGATPPPSSSGAVTSSKRTCLPMYPDIRRLRSSRSSSPGALAVRTSTSTILRASLANRRNSPATAS